MANNKKNRSSTSSPTERKSTWPSYKDYFSVSISLWACSTSWINSHVVFSSSNHLESIISFCFFASDHCLVWLSTLSVWILRLSFSWVISFMGIQDTWGYIPNIFFLSFKGPSLEVGQVGLGCRLFSLPLHRFILLFRQLKICHFAWKKNEN